MILKFKIFEDKLRDQLILIKLKSKKNISDSDTFSHIKKEMDEKFSIDEDFIRTININGEELKFNWNHRVDHDLFKKIQKRTHLKSISEFNDIFVKTIKQIIPSKLGKSGIEKDGCYALYLKENCFYIMIQIDPNALIDGIFVDHYGNKKPYHSFIVTIHNNSTLDKYKYYKKIDIDDSEFNI